MHSKFDAIPPLLKQLEFKRNALFTKNECKADAPSANLQIHFPYYLCLRSFTVLLLIIPDCITRQQLQRSSMTLQKINPGLVQGSTDHGRHFQAHTTICPSQLNLEAQEKQGQRHRNTAQTQMSRFNTSTGPLQFCFTRERVGEREKKEGKKRNRSDLSVPSPTSCFNPLWGTSYITVPLFHLERRRFQTKTERLKSFTERNEDMFNSVLIAFYYWPNFRRGVV